MGDWASGRSDESYSPSLPAAMSDELFVKLCERGAQEEVQTAIWTGARVNARTGEGNTPLHRAAEFNPCPEVVTMLLKAGADVNARNYAGRTPLHSAASRKLEPEVISRLLKEGADTEALDVCLKRPVDYAEANENLRGTEALRILKGADDSSPVAARMSDEREGGFGR